MERAESLEATGNILMVDGDEANSTCRVVLGCEGRERQGQVTEGFEDNSKKFVLDPEVNRKQVLGFKEGCHMIRAI